MELDLEPKLRKNRAYGTYCRFKSIDRPGQWYPGSNPVSLTPYTLPFIHLLSSLCHGEGWGCWRTNSQADSGGEERVTYFNALAQLHITYVCASLYQLSSCYVTEDVTLPWSTDTIRTADLTLHLSTHPPFPPPPPPPPPPPLV